MYDYKNKRLNIKNEYELMLSKTLGMFAYEGLPETIPHRDFERQLQTKGYAFITEFEGDLYSFNGGLGGLPDAYGNPTEIVIANPSLKFNKTLNIKEDGVLIRNDSTQSGIKRLIQKHLFMLNENEITMTMANYNSRMPTLISAGDDATKESAEEYLRQIVKGEMGIIGENRLFEGINVQVGSAGGFTELIEYNQFIKASLFNELGLEMNNNMKRERLTEDEVNQVDAIYPFVDNMMLNRDEGIKEVNKKYGRKIEIEFDSIWSQHNEQSDEEFMEDVEMYLNQMGGGQPEEGQSDEELMQVLAELQALADEEVDDGPGNNDDDSERSDTDVGKGESESSESDEDTRSGGGTRTDDNGPDDDNTGQDSESSGRSDDDRERPEEDSGEKSEQEDTESTESSSDDDGDGSRGSSGNGSKQDDATTGTESTDGTGDSSTGDTESRGRTTTVEVKIEEVDDDIQSEDVDVEVEIEDDEEVEEDESK